MKLKMQRNSTCLGRLRHRAFTRAGWTVVEAVYGCWGGDCAEDAGRVPSPTCPPVKLPAGPEESSRDAAFVSAQPCWGGLWYKAIAFQPSLSPSSIHLSSTPIKTNWSAQLDISRTVSSVGHRFPMWSELTLFPRKGLPLQGLN